MERIKILRSKKGWSQKKLADKIKRTRSALSMWETSGVEPDNEALIALADALDTSVDYLIERTDYSDAENHTLCTNISLLLKKCNSDLGDGSTWKFFPPEMLYNINSGTYKFKKDTLDSIAQFIGVPSATLLNRKTAPPPDVLQVPVLGEVAAGIPIEAIEEVIDYEEVDAQQFDSSYEYFGLKIKGDSMMPRIQSGDVVIARKQSDVDNGEVAIVCINGDSATCKQIKKHTNGITLISYNASYEPMFFTREEIESKPITILGKVIELRGKF